MEDVLVKRVVSGKERRKDGHHDEKREKRDREPECDASPAEPEVSTTANVRDGDGGRGHW
jgi:hypothetical protein